MSEARNHSASSNRRRAPRKLSLTRKTPPVVIIKPATRVWTTALEIAGGDTRRLEPLPDGTVLIHNERVR